MRKLSYFITILLVFNIIITSVVFSDSGENDTDISSKDKGEEYWGLEEINNLEKMKEKELETVRLIKGLVEEEGFNTPIKIKDWYTIMESLLQLNDSKSNKKIKGYTFDLSDDKYVTRENAIIGIMKLVPDDPRDATEEELSKTENHFKDFNDIDDTSKVSQAFVQGLIKGYEDSTFKPNKNMTYGEAAVLIVRVIEKMILIKKI